MTTLLTPATNRLRVYIHGAHLQVLVGGSFRDRYHRMEKRNEGLRQRNLLQCESLQLPTISKPVFRCFQTHAMQYLSLCDAMPHMIGSAVDKKVTLRLTQVEE